MASFQKVKWEQKTLSQLGFIGRGKSKHRPRNDQSLYEGKYPFVQTSDIKHANFYVNSYSQTYNEVGLKQSKLWEKDTLCMIIAANIAETALLSFPACFPDSIVGFVADPEKSNVKFVKYALDLAKKSFQNRAQGAAQDNLSLEKIDNLKIGVPDPKTQNKIASVLSAYDDLIENNEKRIKALEEMAQLLYTEWFVPASRNGGKFKFPGHEKVKMVESGTEYGMVPEGWEVVSIESLLGTVKRKPKIQSGDYLESGSYPVVDQGKEFIGGYTENKDAVYDQDLIVFGDHSRCFKYCNFPFASGADGTQLLITNDSDRMPQTLLYYITINSGLTNYNYARHFKFLKAIKVIKSDSDTAKKFDNVIAQSFSMIRKLRDKNYLLSKTRDLLIPQLVTGRRELKQQL